MKQDKTDSIERAAPDRIVPLSDITARVFSIKPGDVLVLNVPYLLSEAEYNRLKAEYEATFAGLDGVKVVLLEGDMDLHVLRQGEAEPTEQ
jgi:hypothetical protein